VARILRDVGVTSIFVTHDQDEAFVLGDQVAVMRSGRIEQIGTPDGLYRAPATPWVAGFVGEANIVTGTLIAGDESVITPLGLVPVSGLDRLVGSPTVTLLVRPEQIALQPLGDTDVGNAAEVTTVEYYGHDVRYELLLDDGSSLAARAHPDRLFERGDRVAVRFDGSTTEAWPA
jgi:iron(III) transport system ATP-binding protein